MAIITVTDPHRLRYWTFYACVASWARYCDRVIVVDGGSKENLLEIPSLIFGDMPNVEIVYNKRTYWGPGTCWHASQHSVNVIEGIRFAGENAAVFVVDADQVLYPPPKPLANYLNFSSVKIPAWFCFYRTKLRGNYLVRQIDNNGRLVLSGLTANGSPKLVIGYDILLRMPSDFPILAKQRSLFTDPVTGTVKTIYAGHTFAPSAILNIECGTFGHFWFTVDDCLHKLRRFAYVIARLFGSALPRDLELVFRAKLSGILGYRSKEEMLKMDFPPPMKQLIGEFYEPGMLGGAIYAANKAQHLLADTLLKLLYLERKMRTIILRGRGFTGLYDQHIWVALDEPDPKPVDVLAVYKEQDQFLSERYRFDNSKVVAN